MNLLDVINSLRNELGKLLESAGQAISVATERCPPRWALASSAGRRHCWYPHQKHL
jgi:hypothetical protein